LLAEPLSEDLSPLLHGLEERDIDRLMASFCFENCRPRPELVQIIKKEQARSVAPAVAPR